ncbi:hypothetical protein [Agromyces bauzanensis]
MHDLASMFSAQQTNEIDWRGQLFSLYDLSTDVAELTIRFVSSAAALPQGLHVKVRGGSLEIGGVIAADMVLWRDTAPETVQVAVRWSPRGPRSLRIWNTWRDGGVSQAWLGNAGMRVDTREDGRLTFRCSDGVGEPDFEDLVATMELG